MSSPARDFVYTELPAPHRERAKNLLRTHPEVRSLIGRNPYSALLVLVLVGLQVGIAFLVKDEEWWVALLCGYLVGAFANHALFVLIHECTHNLVLRRNYGNIMLGILADLPNVIPSAISFRTYHLNHHSYLGEYARDADLANRWEARVVGSGFPGKAMWLLLFPLFQALRTPRLRGIPFLDGWTVVNWIVAFVFDVVVFLWLGPTALLYLVASLFSAIGLHPLGARWIQEHYLVSPPQETYSYYGVLNLFALNVGFHNEHHDLPSVPWNRLPALKAAAPEMYNTLVFHRSWAKLLWRFLWDAKLSLYSRMVRTNRGAVVLQAE